MNYDPIKKDLGIVFNQNTFIGYTATPYANLFISQEHNEDLTTIVKNKEYIK